MYRKERVRGVMRLACPFVMLRPCSRTVRRSGRNLEWMVHMRLLMRMHSNTQDRPSSHSKQRVLLPGSRQEAITGVSVLWWLSNPQKYVQSKFLWLRSIPHLHFCLSSPRWPREITQCPLHHLYCSVSQGEHRIWELHESRQRACAKTRWKQMIPSILSRFQYLEKFCRRWLCRPKTWCVIQGVIRRDEEAYICADARITNILYSVVLSDAFSGIVNHLVQFFTTIFSISGTGRWLLIAQKHTFTSFHLFLKHIPIYNLSVNNSRIIYSELTNPLLFVVLSRKYNPTWAWDSDIDILLFNHIPTGKYRGYRRSIHSRHEDVPPQPTSIHRDGGRFWQNFLLCQLTLHLSFQSWYGVQSDRRYLWVSCGRIECDCFEFPS